MFPQSPGSSTSALLAGGNAGQGKDPGLQDRGDPGDTVRAAQRDFTPAQVALEGHGFAASTAKLAVTTISLSPPPTTPLGEDPSPSSEPLQAISSAFLSLGQKGVAKGRTRSKFPESQTQMETVTPKRPQVWNGHPRQETQSPRTGRRVHNTP